MNKRDIEIDGLDKLMDKLTAIGDNSQKALHNGLMKGGKAVRGMAKKLCPVDTGLLRNSIAVESQSKTEVAVGTNIEYAPYVEFGTGQKGDPSVEHRQDWAGQSPQPFLSPALALSEEEVKQKVTEELKKAIREAVGNG